MKLITSILILSLIHIITFGQESRELPEIKIKKINNNSVSFSESEVLEISGDPVKDYSLLTFKTNGEKKLIDTVGFSPYGMNFRLFNFIKGKILLSEIQYELFSEYPIYIIEEKEIGKIGNLNIGLDCKNCDSMNYPLSEINVKGTKNQIVFSFSKDLVLLENNETISKKKDEIKFIYNIAEKEFIIK